MLIASWNVNGLRACATKGFGDWLDAFAPDVCLLQETKARADDLDDELRARDGWHARFHAAAKKGYSGVAVYCRDEPDEWVEGLGKPKFDDEGRVLGARFGDRLVVSVYFPNSQAEGARLDYRLAFGRAFKSWLDDWVERGVDVVVGGDFNVAHEPIDLARPKQNEKNPGYLPEERRWMSRFLKAGWVDSFRQLHPGAAEAYSWWSYRFNARAKNIGWRLDYLCVNERLAPRVADARILHEVLGSDHCPVTVELR